MVRKAPRQAKALPGYRTIVCLRKGLSSGESPPHCALDLRMSGGGSQRPLPGRLSWPPRHCPPVIGGVRRPLNTECRLLVGQPLHHTNPKTMEVATPLPVMPGLRDNADWLRRPSCPMRESSRLLGVHAQGLLARDGGLARRHRFRYNFHKGEWVWQRDRLFLTTYNRRRNISCRALPPRRAGGAGSRYAMANALTAGDLTG